MEGLEQGGERELMQIMRLLLTFCLVVGVTLILSGCAPKAPEETTAPVTTEEEEAVAPEEEAMTEEAAPAAEEEAPAEK